MTTVTVPVNYKVTTERAITDAEWKLIQRLRQVKRQGDGNLLLLDPRTMKLQLVVGEAEKLDE